MIHPTRVRRLNEAPEGQGRYVLYWMQASQRTRSNHALEHAVRRADALGLPLVVCFGLMDDYPEANARHYTFLLEGLADVARNLAARGIAFVVRRGSPPDVALHYAKGAAIIVCDVGYLRHQRRWRNAVADGALVTVVEVESDVVIPLDIVSEKQEYAARTIRPRSRKHWAEYLKPLALRNPKRSALHLDVAGDIDVSDPAAALARLTVDRSVPPSPHFHGGEDRAAILLADFCARRLPGYAAARSEPAAAHTSTLSAYLHFGQVSPLEIALAILAAGAGGGASTEADRDAYLEELIVRRELACNYVAHSPHYDAYAGLPEWARKTLSEHRNDPRPALYPLAALESAATADPYWNAAQREMTLTGFMHNTMRMYWGKKILEWTPSPEEAFARTLHLNNKYFLCGRDPNAYTNVAWIFGLHDRPWACRKVFGTIRYMAATGLERKFDINAYVRRVDALATGEEKIDQPRKKHG